METRYGFTKLAPSEFEGWLQSQSISRTCVRVQEHHTWKPRYSNFNGNNHFQMQRNMKRYHMNRNGWSDIGQHFSIFPDGMILTGRPLNRTPACILYANSGAICIENVGNFDAGGDTMDQAQSDSIFLCTAALLRKIGIAIPSQTNVVYHHWYDGDGRLVYYNSGQKTCPGTAFFGGNQLPDFTANFLPLLQQAMDTGGQPPRGLLSWAVVTVENLNIRTGPSSDADLANDQGPLNYGSIVRVYEISPNRWLRISQDRQLWVYGRYTRQVRPATVNTPDTNARIGPGTDHDVVQVLQQGDRVFVQKQEGSWSQTTEDHWIHGSLLDFDEG
ncbi:MAG: N-acetylmuramoyl-L-alanine amidase [Hyphomicrobiaceae bacterium]|nr:N-acetylmuramoyl-L-alanine amidase [Hyphomicrobiaceae bacterium]